MIMRAIPRFCSVLAFAVSCTGATASITIEYEYISATSDSGGLLLPGEELSFLDRIADEGSGPGSYEALLPANSLVTSGGASIEHSFDGSTLHVEGRLLDLHAEHQDSGYAGVFAQGRAYFQFWLRPRDHAYEYTCTVEQNYDEGLSPAFGDDATRPFDLFTVLQGVGGGLNGEQGTWYYSGVLEPGDYQWYGGIRAAAWSDENLVGPAGGRVTVNLSLSAVPDDYLWIGAGGALFGGASNWDPSGPPGPGDLAVFQAPALVDQNVTFDQSHENARMMVTSPPEQEQSSQVIFDLKGNTYTLTRDWNDAVGGSVTIGDENNGNARLRVTGGTVDARDCEIGLGGYAELTVDAGGLWTAYQHAVSVGTRSSGTLNILNGGRVQHGHGDAGQEPQAYGLVDVSGHDGAQPELPSVWQVTGWFGLGVSGAGELAASSGAAVEIGKCDMAVNPGSWSLAAVAGQGSYLWLTAPDEVALVVGRHGDASVQVADGGSLFSQGEIHVAEEPGSTGSIWLSALGRTSSGDASSTLDCFRSLVVGQKGVGEFGVENDAWAIVRGALIVRTDVDAPPGIASRIDVDGADAFVDVTGRDGESHVGLEVGREGTGSSLRIAAGGQVDVEYIATIGGASVGSLTVEGEDSLLTAKLQLEVGRDGPGEVLVSGGARIDVNASNGDPEVGEGFRGLVFIGMRAPGSLTIQGGGPSTASSLEAAAQMSVGAGAGGTLQVEQGAQLVTHRRASATNTAGIVGRDSGSLGVVTITDAGSVWDMPDGGLTVGWFGDGMMHVKDGGLVVCQHAIAGRAPDSRGEVHVWSEIEGVESRWEIFGPLAVGGDLEGATGGEARVVAGLRGVVYSPDLTIVYPPGAVELLGGVFEAAQGIELYGTLEGYGTLYGEIRNVDGIVRPHEGGTGLLPELAMADSYIQEDAGEFSVEVRGGDAGQITVLDPGDTARLAGLLSVHVMPGTVPSVGTEYEIVSAPGGVIGTFTSYNLPQLDGQPVFEVIYESGAVKLRALAEYRCKADLDLDLDVDADDVGEFAACATRSGVPVAGESCRRADFDGDSDVDMDDFAVLQRCYSGSQVPARPECAE